MTTERWDRLDALAAAATPGPWRWAGEDYRGGWGWQLLVGSKGEGIIIGQGLDGGPSEHLRAFMSVDPALCLTGMVADGTPHVEPVHVQEADAAFIAACDPATIRDLVAAARRGQIAEDVLLNDFGEPICASCKHAHNNAAWSDRDPDDGTCWSAGALVCGCPKFITPHVQSLRLARRAALHSETTETGS